ncbi:GumC family protein [Rhizobiaceae bacterium n13]|uniref:GumC family protein n=1 Tax=Ferirhizobium litorale TaxID=2927786 RepID=A0AAE3TZZ8_9HYPH|nr:GumC family protein [Fererhizobium litorale]MDI7860623.1 GumC family protein [Fererhizobium litorale]MDI7920771.1 GumC family protein [Fererhizobium litorale]
MSWLGSNTKAAEATDLPAPGEPKPVAAVRRGPVVRTADYITRRVPEVPPEPVVVSDPKPVVHDEQIKAHVVVEPVSPSVSGTEPEKPPEIAGADIPLFDLASIARATWTYRRPILGLAVAGALLGGGLMAMSARKYTAETSLYFDPRQVQITRSAEGGESASPTAVTAIIDSQARILTSNRVLERVAEKLELAKDPDFAVKAAGTDGVPYGLVARLQQSTSITRDDNTYIVSLKVTTGDGAKSAGIANAIVDAYLEEENQAVSGIYRSANSALDGRLAELGAKVQAAEKAVEDFRARNDMVTAEGDLISDKRLVSLNELLVTAQNRTIEAKAKVTAASNLKVEDALAGNSANSVASATLVDLRRQYAAQAASIGSMESRMGPRHPSLLAAKGSLEGLKAEIRNELQRIVSVAESEQAQAQKAEEDVAKELTIQKALQANTSMQQIDLNELQREATAARDIYETVLKRARETSEDLNLVRSNVRVISKAEMPLKADGPGTKMRLIAGILGGLILGLALGIGLAVLRSLLVHPFIRSAFREFSASTENPKAS